VAFVFGYGSLLFRQDFPHAPPRVAIVHGWTRRFDQGSHDHRGTPEQPGRVVTLVPQDGAACEGAVFEIADRDEASVLAALDVREQGGYERCRVRATLRDTGERVDAITWIAQPDNAFSLGPAPMDAMARQMAAASGPSGSNVEYVLRLARVLRELAIDDPHVYELAARLEQRSGGERSER